MRWSATGAETLLDAAVSRFEGTPWPGPPSGFELFGAPRNMRRVLTGSLEGRRVFVKWSRPVTTTDHVARALRGGKGPREGRVLRALRERDIPVPEPLAYTDDGVDLLVTARIENALPLPIPEEASRVLIERVGALLGRAYAAGLRHRDLHADNFLVHEGQPILVDLGGARLVRHDGGEVRELARLQHGMASQLSRAGRVRGFSAWLHEAGVPTVDRRDLIRRVDREAREVARRYRRGRDRRATRTGRHYELFEVAGAGSGVRRQETPSFWPAALPEWLEDDPPEASPLKADGRVIRTRLPGLDEDVVLKRYEAAAAGRLPRAVRAFRKAVWLEHRGIAAPSPLLALSGPLGASLLVSEFVDGLDLHTLLLESGEGLSRVERAVLADRLGRFLRHMHDAEISHRDLKAPNLLVVGDEPRFLIADVDGVARREVDWRRRARNIARLDASVEAHATDRARVLRAYWRSGSSPPVTQRDFTRWIARAVARKRGPAGLPR